MDWAPCSKGGDGRERRSPRHRVSRDARCSRSLRAAGRAAYGPQPRYACRRPRHNGADVRGCGTSAACEVTRVCHSGPPGADPRTSLRRCLPVDGNYPSGAARSLLRCVGLSHGGVITGGTVRQNQSVDGDRPASAPAAIASHRIPPSARPAVVGPVSGRSRGSPYADPQGAAPRTCAASRQLGVKERRLLYGSGRSIRPVKACGEERIPCSFSPALLPPTPERIETLPRGLRRVAAERPFSRASWTPHR